MNRMTRRPPREEKTSAPAARAPSRDAAGADRERTSTPRRPELAALPSGMRVQHAFILRAHALPPREMNAVREDAVRLASRSYPIEAKGLLDGWVNHARAAAERYKATSQSNAADDARHLAFAMLWTATVRAGGHVASEEKLRTAMTSESNPNDPRQQRAAAQVREGVRPEHHPRTGETPAAAIQRLAIQQGPRPDHRTEIQEAKAAAARGEPDMELVGTDARTRERMLQKDIQRVLNFACHELTPQARRHIIEIAQQAHKDASMSPDDARVAFEKAYAPTRQAPPTADELRNLMVLAAVASVRPVNDVVVDIERLQAPTVLELKREVRDRLAPSTTHPDSVRQMEREYERRAIVAAVTPNPSTQREAMLAALAVSMQRARISGSDMDWDRAATQFGRWQDLPPPA